MAGRINPIYLARSVSYDSDLSPHSSPKAKLVNTCVNCNYAFRLGSSDSVDFCSKDCQTCYLIYTSNPSHTPKSRKTEIKSSKQLVYEFQREIDRQNDESARDIDDEKMVLQEIYLQYFVRLTRKQKVYDGPTLVTKDMHTFTVMRVSQ